MGNIPDMEEWTHGLDRLLSQDGFRSMAKVSIYLASSNRRTDVSSDFPPDTEDYIVRQMPLLQKAGVLKVGRIKTWKDRDAIYEGAIKRTLGFRKA